MMVSHWLGRSRPESANSVGWFVFQLGLFFLASSAFLAGLFLLVALLFSRHQREGSYFKDPWNYPLFIAGVLMVLGCLRAYSGWLAWVGLANWLPFFWGFWGFQAYLLTIEARRRCAFCLLVGTVPVVITGFGQLLLGWQGPWQLFNGLIVWFIAPGGQPTGRLSGLFDYANIAGAWLALVWPISLATVIQPSSNVRNRVIAFLLAVGIVASLVLTESRNAWGALVVAIPFVLGPSHWPWLLPLLLLSLMPIVFAVLPWFGLELQQWARSIVPEGLWSRLNDMRYTQERVLASTRLSQWQEAIKLVIERPWVGWGAAAFSVIYPLRTGQWHGHAHNLPLELAVSHGFLVALLIISTVLALLITALYRGVLTNRKQPKGSIGASTFDRAWWSASFVLVVMHGADIPFFDSRLNIAGWVLLAGLRCLIMPKTSMEKFLRKPLDDVGSVSLV